MKLMILFVGTYTIPDEDVESSYDGEVDPAKCAEIDMETVKDLGMAEFLQLVDHEVVYESITPAMELE